MVDDGIEGCGLGEAEVEGSRSCETFVRRNNESEGYDDTGGHRFVVHGLYRRCTVLKMTLDMLVEVRDSEDVTRCATLREKSVEKTVTDCHRANAKRSI